MDSHQCGSELWSNRLGTVGACARETSTRTTLAARYVSVLLVPALDRMRWRVVARAGKKQRDRCTLKSTEVARVHKPLYGRNLDVQAWVRWMYTKSVHAVHQRVRCPSRSALGSRAGTIERGGRRMGRRERASWGGLTHVLWILRRI